jgi:hypothetical protein
VTQPEPLPEKAPARAFLLGYTLFLSLLQTGLIAALWFWLLH